MFDRSALSAGQARTLDLALGMLQGLQRSGAISFAVVETAGGATSGGRKPRKDRIPPTQHSIPPAVRRIHAVLQAGGEAVTVDVISTALDGLEKDRVRAGLSMLRSRGFAERLNPEAGLTAIAYWRATDKPLPPRQT
jgi:hypothetical protein